MSFGEFNDSQKSYRITQPTVPRPWINYLSNRRLNAFISQNAGGLLWYKETQSRRITRYHYTASPQDRPGFYVYIKNKNSGSLWNPHFAPTCTPLDEYHCQHSPGITSFSASKEQIHAQVSYGMAPQDDVMLWKVKLTNNSAEKVELQATSYMEFGLLEFYREIIGWCVLKNQIEFYYDPETRSIQYVYHVFEAPHLPAMAFSCTESISGFECSREAFIGPTGSLENPESLRDDGSLSGSELPLGGHGCGTLATDIALESGESKEFAFYFAYTETWDEMPALLEKYSSVEKVNDGFAAIDSFYDQRLDSFQVKSNDETFDRFINTWIPYNCLNTLPFCRTISTDHMGMGGLRYRDTMQDALAVSSIDPEYAKHHIDLILAQQLSSGMGCYAFYPGTNQEVSENPRRCDNTVWTIYTIKNYLAETGDEAYLDQVIPFRDQGEATVYEHMLLGLKFITNNLGPQGLPTLYHADWNDSLALFEDEEAESVMLAMQLVSACRDFIEIAELKKNAADIKWCIETMQSMIVLLNSDKVWDGEWYRRLLLSNGKTVGSVENSQGQIYLNTQSWSVISGVGDHEKRSIQAMNSVYQRLNSKFGVCIHRPAFKGFPEPDDPPKGSNPGVGENGGIFCHANTWAIIAECLLGNGKRAYQYFRQILPEIVSNKAGPEEYGREPYAFVSSIVGPDSERFGEGGISWLTGTASWMYIAGTQYILGIRPTFHGLTIDPCLPKTVKSLSISRVYRGCRYDIEINNQQRGKVTLEVDGVEHKSNTITPKGDGSCKVICLC